MRIYPGWMIPPMKGCLFPQQEIEVLPADAGDAAESCIGEQCPVEFDLAFFQFHHSGAPSYIILPGGSCPSSEKLFPAGRGNVKGCILLAAKKGKIVSKEIGRSKVTKDEMPGKPS